MIKVNSLLTEELDPEIKKIRDKIITKIGNKPLDEVNVIIKKLLNDQMDETTRLGALAARVKIIRARIEELYENKEIKKKVEKKPIEKKELDNSNVIDNEKKIEKEVSSEWVRVKMLEPAEVYSKQIDKGVILDVKKEDSEKLISQKKAEEFFPHNEEDKKSSDIKDNSIEIKNRSNKIEDKKNEIKSQEVNNNTAKNENNTEVKDLKISATDKTTSENEKSSAQSEKISGEKNISNDETLIESNKADEKLNKTNQETSIIEKKTNDNELESPEKDKNLDKTKEKISGTDINKNNDDLNLQTKTQFSKEDKALDETATIDTKTEMNLSDSNEKSQEINKQLNELSISPQKTDDVKEEKDLLKLHEEKIKNKPE